MAIPTKGGHIAYNRHMMPSETNTLSWYAAKKVKSFKIKPQSKGQRHRLSAKVIEHNPYNI